MSQSTNDWPDTEETDEESTWEAVVKHLRDDEDVTLAMWGRHRLVRLVCVSEEFVQTSSVCRVYL